MKKNGFTLIELLVVIALIAILLMIAIPAVLNVRNKAEQALSKEQEKNIKDAALVVAVDLDDYMSNIYNCKSGSWISEGNRCEKNEDTKKWYRIAITVEDLVTYGYFDDTGNHCSGNLSITKNTNEDGKASYEAKLLTVKCGK